MIWRSATWVNRYFSVENTDKESLNSGCFSFDFSSIYGHGVDKWVKTELDCFCVISFSGFPIHQRSCYPLVPAPGCIVYV